MTDEIIIGKIPGKGKFVVDAQYSDVSRQHAKIVRKSDGIYIEDLNSTNYTYVNGIAVKKKKVSAGDRISLGGPNYCIVNLKDVLALMPMSDEEFSKRFLKLEKVYEDFQRENTRLLAKGQEDMMTKRMLPTMLVGVLTGIIANFVDNNPESVSFNPKILVGIIGGILTVIVFIVATKMATKSSTKMRSDLNKLNEDFEMDYVCPNCTNSLGGRSWRALEKAGKCPLCKRCFKD